MPSEKEIRDREAQIRKNLGEQLGIELCSEEELATEQKIAENEQKVVQHIPKVKTEPPQVTVTDIITMCNEAISKMGAKNPNRHLLYLCASALRQMSDRLYTYEMKVN